MRTVFFDLETGGTDIAKHPIIQIAAVACDEKLQEIESFEVKLRFDAAQCDRKALELNCYDCDKWIAEAISPQEAIGRFSRFLKKYSDVRMISQRTGSPYNVAQLIGYNAATFDGPFIQQLYKECDAFLPASFRVLCVLQRVCWKSIEREISIDHLKDLKLGTVAAHFGVPLEGAHDALADVRATIGIYRALTAR